jgi:hypothetical protein
MILQLANYKKISQLSPGHPRGLLAAPKSGTGDRPKTRNERYSYCIPMGLHPGLYSVARNELKILRHRRMLMGTSALPSAI